MYAPLDGKVIPRVCVCGGGGGYSVWKSVPTLVRRCRVVAVATTDRFKKKCVCVGGGGGSCPLIILYKRGAVRVFATNILDEITIVWIKFVFKIATIIWYITIQEIQKIHHLLLILRDCSWASTKRGGLYIWR